VRRDAAQRSSVSIGPGIVVVIERQVALADNAALVARWHVEFLVTPCRGQLTRQSKGHSDDCPELRGEEMPWSSASLGCLVCCLVTTLADANILISRTLPDYFVYSAKLGAVDIHWSETILDETSRNLIKQFGFTSEDADVRIERLEAYLPQRWSR
jgi:hypothetical protein